MSDEESPELVDDVDQLEAAMAQRSQGRTPQTIPHNLDMAVPLYAMHAVDQERIAHLQYKADLQDQQIRGQNMALEDANKYHQDYLATLSGLIGDIEAYVNTTRRGGKLVNWMQYAIIALISIAGFGYLYEHPQFLQTIAENGVAISLVVLLVLLSVGYFVWRRFKK